MQDMTDIAETLDRQGYCSVTGTFDADQIETLRKTVNRVLDDRGIDKAGGTVLPNAAVAAPELSWVLTYEPILVAVRAALACSNPLFTLEADLHRNYLAARWHKDTGERVVDGGYFGTDPFGQSDCRVVKVAIYLQGYRDGRGLRVRPGSNRSREMGAGNGVEIKNQAGDIVLFDVRTTHRGVRPGKLDFAAAGLSRFAARGKRAEAAAVWRRRLGRWTSRPDRLAIYFAFGIPNEMSETFASRNMSRQLTQLGQRLSGLPPQLIQTFSESGVKIAEMAEL